MSLLADRPGCCAKLREAAGDEITFLRSEVERLNRCIEGNYREMRRMSRESQAAVEMVKAYLDMGNPFDIDDWKAACGNSVASKCRNWRALKPEEFGPALEEAAKEIERLICGSVKE